VTWWKTRRRRGREEGRCSRSVRERTGTAYELRKRGIGERNDYLPILKRNTRITAMRGKSSRQRLYKSLTSHDERKKNRLLKKDDRYLKSSHQRQILKREHFMLMSAIFILHLLTPNTSLPSPNNLSISTSKGGIAKKSRAAADCPEIFVDVSIWLWMIFLLRLWKSMVTKANRFFLFRSHDYPNLQQKFDELFESLELELQI